MEMSKTFAIYASSGMEMTGVAFICIGVLFSSLRAVICVMRREEVAELTEEYRHGIIRSILVGLDLLVAADIMDTVAVSFSYHSVGVLAVIVIIRTFLSFTLELEMTGRWPWSDRGA